MLQQILITIAVYVSYRCRDMAKPGGEWCKYSINLTRHSVTSSINNWLNWKSRISPRFNSPNSSDACFCFVQEI